MGTMYKTVYQYNKSPISDADMEKLKEIAKDCRTVRNYIYDRYGGIGGLPKLYPGYTIQNEMTKSGLRERLGLPSVYFYLSIFTALGDIKCQWTKVKSQVEKNVRAHPDMTLEERHYLRFAMKQSQCFEAVLAGGEAGLSGEWKETWETLRDSVDAPRLNKYLCRQVRRHLKKPRSDDAGGFPVSPKGYRYGDHGIYLSMKESRRRLFIPLTDNNQYSRQIYIRLYPEERKVSISVPVEVRQRHPAGYGEEVGLALGLKCMFVTDKGTRYGEDYLEYQSALTDYVRESLPRHKRNGENNRGRKKYMAKRARLERALHDYVNAEINRMLKTEKPGTVYIPRLPASSKAGVNRRMNATVSMWQRGFVKGRLAWKCRERSIELVEVFGKGIGSQCSSCGAEGSKDGETFACPACGQKIPERQNTAGNVLKRGRKLREERQEEK